MGSDDPRQLTTRVMARGQQDAAGGLPFANHMAGSRRAQPPLLADEQLLHAIGGTDLRDGLDDLGVVVAAITTNDQARSLRTLRDGQEDACDEGFQVIRLLEDGYSFSQPRAERRLAKHTRSMKENRIQYACPTVSSEVLTFQAFGLPMVVKPI
jgi:hypothetical protein